jgi:GT2 family glycosyltransferase
MILSIIIVYYNTQKLTVATLHSVLREIRSSSILKNNTEIFIVDNNSQDGSINTLKALRQEYPQELTLILNKENGGFAKANNLAIEKSQGKYILLLNSDTVVQNGAVEKMVQAFESNPPNDRTATLSSEKGKLDRLGVLAATLYNPNGTLQRQGGSFPTLRSLVVHMWMLDDVPVLGKFFPSTQHTGKSHQTHLKQLDWVGGTALMVRRAVFEEVGLLDHNIFMYGEDVEFCMRAKDHHWDVSILPTAQITHFGSASSSSANAIIGEIKGYLYIWAKHKPFWQMPLLKFILRTGVLLRIFIFGTIMRNKEKVRPYVTLLKDVLR